LDVGWYVVFRERSETLTQTAEDKDDALLVACDLSLRGRQVLSVGPFGRHSLTAREIEGAELRDILRKLATEEAKASDRQK
jgi:hypothetical protein